MKKTIVLALALISFGANAQKKLTGMATQQFDETGALVSVDSSDYTYNSWEGSITSNEPVFKFDTPVFDWVYEKPTATWNTENVYSGTPLQLDYTRQNTITNGNLVDSEVAQNDRTEYTYDAAGNVTMIQYFFYNVSQFDIYAERTFEYDANNNLTVETYISDPTGSPITESIDSMFYDASDNLVRAISYEWDASNSTLYGSSESLLTYTGSELTDLQLYEGSSTSPLEWSYDIDYNYSGGLPSLLEAYEVTGGVPAATPEVEIEYTYNANNQLELYEGMLGGDLFAQRTYTYDAEGFLSEMEISELDFINSVLYLSEVVNFYYQSTAGIGEPVQLEASVYPNPSTDVITLSTEAEVEQVAIYGVNGNLLIQQNGETIDVSNLPAGTYIAKVKTSNGMGQTRFVKK